MQRRALFSAWLALCLMLCLAGTASARQRVQGWCENGGVKVTIGNQSSTNTFQQSYPQCTVTVYNAGTLVKPGNIYSDNNGTVLSNPFSSGTDGRWEFYADNGRYDAALSGGGITIPFTIADIVLFDPATPGTLNITSLNNIKFASQFAGADCGAKINAADSVLGTHGGQIWVDKACGTTITTQIVLHNSLKFIDDATYTLSGASACPISVPTGGIIIEGMGLDTTGGTSPATDINYSCTGNLDMFSVLGTMANRLGSVVIKNLFVAGGGSARYCIRAEKVDLFHIEDVQLNNCGTGHIYIVDSTGDRIDTTRIATIPVNGLVLDWGTGQFTGSGLVFESQACNSNPMLTVQGSGSGQSFYGTTMQLDGCTGTWGGFIKIGGFDTNSSFAGAPTGGAGAPVGPGFYNLNITVASNGGNSSLGADILVSGTATNPPQDTVFLQAQTFGNGFSTVAYKMDQSKGFKVVEGFSNGHGTATFNPTNNALYSQALGLTSLDTATCAGTCPSGIAIINSQNLTGRWDLNNGLVSGDGTSALPAWSFSADTGNGFSRPGNNYVRYSSSGGDILSMGTSGQVFGLNKSISFAVSDSYSSSNHLLFINTAPTISTHFNTSGDSIVANGTASFTITVGTGAGTSTGAISLPTVTTAWNCHLENTNRADLIQQSGAGSTTGATFTNFGTTFAATNWTNGDVLRGGCTAN